MKHTAAACAGGERARTCLPCGPCTRATRARLLTRLPCVHESRWSGAGVAMVHCQWRAVQDSRLLPDMRCAGLLILWVVFCFCCCAASASLSHIHLTAQGTTGPARSACACRCRVLWVPEAGCALSTGPAGATTLRLSIKHLRATGVVVVTTGSLVPCLCPNQAARRPRHTGHPAGPGWWGARWQVASSTHMHF